MKPTGISWLKTQKFGIRRKGGFFKIGVLIATMCILTMGLWMPRTNAQVPVIIDQDMSSDWDDVGALAEVEVLADRGECQIIGQMCSSTDGGTPLCMNAISTYFGRPNIPVGVPPNISAGAGGKYPGIIASEFPHPEYAGSVNCPLAATLYRQLLAAEPNNSVVIITTGFMVNLAALLETGSDQYSPLTGSQLVAQKVKLWACMGGQYPNGNEFNFEDAGDGGSSTYLVVNNWPAPVMYSGFEIGGTLFTGGSLVSGTGVQANPIAEVWRIEGGVPHPSYDETAGYLGVRTAESEQYLWGTNTVGRNNSTTTGSNYWTATPNPGNEGYLLEIERWPIQNAMDTLMNATWHPKSAGSLAPPTAPTDLRAAPVGSSQINLLWNDNSYNESGFVVERGTNGVYTQIATVGAGVTTYSDTGLSSIINTEYRVHAYNSFGNSGYASITVYSGSTGWTEYDTTYPGSSTPLYRYYQYDNLHWNPTATDSGLAVNNDSTHGESLTINMQVAGTTGYGNYFVYFFFQDANDWYRLNAGSANDPIQGAKHTIQFEKCIGGTISQIGASAPGLNPPDPSMQPWQISVAPTGALQFILSGTTILNVTDSFSFSSGKIALGSNYAYPVWQNFSFITGSSSGSAPGAPSNLAATAGNAQVGLSWTASLGATSYNVYRGISSGGESSTPIAAGITATSSTDTSVTNGTRYYYTVAAVNISGTSSYSNEASATPAAGGSAPAAPAGLTVTAGNAQVALNWTASAGATSYNVYRGTSSGDESGTPIAAGVTAASYTNTGLSNGTTYFYEVAAVNSSGTSSYSNEASGTPTAGNGGINMFTNASFETPSVNGQYSYDPVGSGWTFANNAGIQANGSAYGAPNAPNGTQTALVQSFDSTLGTMSQSVIFSAGTYAISFYASQRPNYGSVQPIQISVDSTVVGTYTPASTSFATITTAPFTVTAGNHTVTFAATNASGDNTSFIDVVSIASISSAPATPTGLAAVSGTAVGQIALSWTASSGAQDYIMRRSTSPGSGYSTIATIAAPAVTYADSSSSLVAGQSYYYEIAAADASGTSVFSTDAFATPYVPATFSGWVYTYFGLNAPSNLTADTADPSNDGLSNLLKYALGLNPLAPATFQPTLSQSGATWQFTYQRPANRPDLTYAVQVSPDLSAWTNTGVTLSEAVSGNPETWQATYTPSIGSKCFFRLQVMGP